MNSYHVYILASKRNGTLYIGVAGDLVSRVSQHKNDLVDGFTKKYQVHTLVYFGEYDDPESAIIKGETAKKVEQEMENRLNRKRKSRMERLIPGLHLTLDSHWSLSRTPIWGGNDGLFFYCPLQRGVWIPNQVGNDLKRTLTGVSFPLKRESNMPIYIGTTKDENGPPP